MSQAIITCPLQTMLSSLAALLCTVLPCELAGQWYVQVQQQPARFLFFSLFFSIYILSQLVSSTLCSSSLQHLPTSALDYSGVHKVAIIGAGAGGSSAAFWLSKAQERNNLSISIDVFESASYVGGRE